MTLAEWCEKHTESVRSDIGLTILPMSRQAWIEAFWLEDHKVSTVSGVVLWLVPSPRLDKTVPCWLAEESLTPLQESSPC